MCVIILKTPEGILTRKHIKEAFRVNSHGSGFMYAEKNRLYIQKGFFGFRKFFAAYSKAQQQHPKSTFVLHFRIASSGKVNVDNCHPFFVQSKAGFCHNGVLSNLAEKNYSDTYVLVRDYLNKLPDEWWYTQEIVDVVDDIAHKSSSKFVLLGTDGQYLIFNEGAGHWRAGCWYSNNSYTITSYTMDNFGMTADSCADSWVKYEDAKVNRLKITPVVQGCICTPHSQRKHFNKDDTPITYDPDEHSCLLCETPIELHELSVSVGDPKLEVMFHKTCFTEIVGNLHVKCPYCSTSTPIRYSLSTEGKMECSCCKKSITATGVAVQLSRMVYDYD
jgi:glutamine amidotransferase